MLSSGTPRTTNEADRAATWASEGEWKAANGRCRLTRSSEASRPEAATARYPARSSRTARAVATLPAPMRATVVERVSRSVLRCVVPGPRSVGYRTACSIARVAGRPSTDFAPVGWGEGQLETERLPTCASGRLNEKVD